MSNDRCDCYECISRREPRDAATHVDGREAPRREACGRCGHAADAHGIDCNGTSACFCIGYKPSAPDPDAATVEAPKRGGHGFAPIADATPCESFRDARAGGPGALYFCDVHIEDPACWHCGAARSKHGPDIEACARAACEAHPSDPEWAISTDAEREMWRKVARAVLAAAGRGVR